MPTLAWVDHILQLLGKKASYSGLDGGGKDVFFDSLNSLISQALAFNLIFK